MSYTHYMGFYSNTFFPWVMNKFMAGEPMDSQRKLLLEGLSGKVLEIGFGSGLNLPYYPQTVTSLVTVDPNPGMNRYARDRIKASRIEVEQLLVSGEAIPVEQASIESVVCSWTLCSIPDIQQALSEVHRILKPGGTFRFLEHGLSPDKSVSRWQHRLNPLQQMIGDGCNLNRDICGLIAAAGFESLHCENFYLEKTPKLLGYMYKGIATK